MSFAQQGELEGASNGGDLRTHHWEEHVLPEEVLRHELSEVAKVSWETQTQAQCYPAVPMWRGLKPEFAMKVYAVWCFKSHK